MMNEADLQQILCAKAIDIRQKAYAPYSYFNVGAALLADDGVIYQGVNVENAAYPLGSCAEAGAIAQMILGGGRKISAIAISGALWEGDGKEVDIQNAPLCTPCGGCRQRIREFASPDINIYICDAYEFRAAFTLKALLPESFGPENL